MGLALVDDVLTILQQKTRILCALLDTSLMIQAAVHDMLHAAQVVVIAGHHDGRRHTKKRRSEEQGLLVDLEKLTMDVREAFVDKYDGQEKGKKDLRKRQSKYATQLIRVGHKLRYFMGWMQGLQQEEQNEQEMNVLLRKEVVAWKEDYATMVKRK